MLGTKKKPSSNNSSVENSQSITTSSKIQAEFLEKILKCINTLIEIASQSNRNLILDQVLFYFLFPFEISNLKIFQKANVYASTRRRKLKFFENFIKKPVVIVLENSEYNTIVKNEEALEEKEINLINDMKSKIEFLIFNFKIKF